MHDPGWIKIEVAAIILSLGAAQSNATEPQPSGGQSQLDLIAAVPFDQALREGGISPPAGPFSSWTADQQRSMPADFQKLCAGFWTFINGADGPPRSRLLPASLSGSDEIRLVMDVCLVAHLPADWPERSAKLQSAAAILGQADQAGASLRLPAQLQHLDARLHIMHWKASCSTEDCFQPYGKCLVPSTDRRERP